MVIFGGGQCVTLDTETARHSEETPNNATSALRFRVAAALMGGIELCYEPEMARAFALAYLGGAQATIEADALEDKLKKHFKIDLSLPRLRKAIRAIRDEIVKTASPERSPYILTSEGGMVANLANAMTMLSQLPLQYNAFTCRPFLTSESPWGTFGNWQDYDDVKSTEWCQRHSLNIEIRTAAAAADAVARGRTPHYHPVRDYLTSLEHDGIERISTWMHDHMGAPDTAYVRAVSRKWLIACVRRAMEPGCQSDYTLVLEGAQGRRKSSALRVLGGDWFTDDIAEIGTKDSAMQLQGKWIVEIAELDAFRRAEMTTIKAWLVRREDHFRPPYGRRPEDFPRQNVFAGSTNKENWGTDETGLRRFWPVRIGEVDIKRLSLARDQIWAEAYACFLAGETSFLNDAAELMASSEQMERQDIDAWRETIEAWLQCPCHKDEPSSFRSAIDRIYLPEILWHCLWIPRKDWNHGQKLRVSRILTLAGYVKRRESKKEVASDGVQREYWIRLSTINDVRHEELLPGLDEADSL